MKLYAQSGQRVGLTRLGEVSEVRCVKRFRIQGVGPCVVCARAAAGPQPRYPERSPVHVLLTLLPGTSAQICTCTGLLRKSPSDARGTTHERLPIELGLPHVLK